MPVDDAVLDAPVVDEVVVDTPAPEETAVADEVAPVVDTPAPETSKRDGRQEPAWLREMKANGNPGYKDAADKFYTLKALDEKLKDRDVDTIFSKLDEHGGLDSLLASYQEREQKTIAMDNIEAALQSGDVGLIATMANSTTPEAFGKLAAASNQEWAQRDPDSWAASMSGVMAATITQSGIPAFLDKMALQLQYNDTASFGESLKMLKEWAGSFQTRASAPPPTKQAAAPDVNKERQEWEMQKFTDGLTQAETAQRDPMIQQELATYIARRPGDKDAAELATSTVAAKVEQRMKDDKDYQSKRAALLARKDKDGALRLAKSREAIAIKEIAPKVGQAVFGNTPTPKPAPTPVRTAVRAAVSTAKSADKFDAVWNS